VAAVGRQQPKAGGRKWVVHLVTSRGGGGTLTGGASATVTSGDIEILIRIRIQTDSNSFKFDRSKKDLPKLKKFEINYGCEGIEERNNIIHRNFSRFEMDLK
jgi:hypothetical protein